MKIEATDARVCWCKPIVSCRCAALLKQAQARNKPRFRLALHCGSVAIGGVPSMGEESLMGKDVNFVFRMEKLAGSLGISFFASQAGQGKPKS
jgi:class 3 adenylate cyclase